ncbi:hypothetical protein [Roseospira goensis]|uniref:Uncharacterized protein n=1 Tax=Roseospira goensis TaxID=391922 RepID=A0A7W6RW43_9PROT|nr:hypothetical protein [Roseospira goensis]MBB4284344.1 hypothetical protein [Roseospira goensis]
MNTPETVTSILSVAHLLAIGTGDNALDLARRRTWLDGRGQPTPAGRDVVAAMRTQRGTRSVFFGAA